MRGILKSFLKLCSPHPNPLPLEREFSLLTVGSDAGAWELCDWHCKTCRYITKIPLIVYWLLKRWLIKYRY